MKQFLRIILFLFYGTLACFAQNVSDPIFTNVIRIDNKHITKLRNKTLIDVSIPTEIQTPIIFVENKILKELLFSLYPQYRNIVFIVPDWNYYENISEDTKLEKAFIIYKLDRQNWHSFVVDSLKRRKNNVPEIKFATNMALENDEIESYYQESYGSVCCPRDHSQDFLGSELDRNFWEKYAGKIGEVYKCIRGKEGEHTAYYTLTGLTAQDKIKFIEERLLAMAEYYGTDTISKPQIYTPFRIEIKNNCLKQ